MKKIENAQQILDIISPIPAEDFCVNLYEDDGKRCFLGHIHNALAEPDDTDWVRDCGDYNGYGARQLTQRFLKEVHGLDANGADVNNEIDVNGYNQPEIKDRVMAMLNDMVAKGY